MTILEMAREYAYSRHLEAIGDDDYGDSGHLTLPVGECPHPDCVMSRLSISDADWQAISAALKQKYANTYVQTLLERLATFRANP